MSDKDENNSNEIIVNESPIDQQLPENVKKLRKQFLQHSVPQFDQYGDGFVAQAYFAARESETGSNYSIAKALKLDVLTFQYYMQKYPDFVMAVNMGKIDGRQERISNLESSLMARALGVEVEEVKTEESGAIDEDGNFKNTFRKVTTTKKQIPPDASAALEILRRVDPNWNPKASLEININDNLKVTEDVNINVDLRTLSPDALREILGSSKQPKNLEINKTPEGETVRFLGEKGEKFREKSKAQEVKFKKVEKEKKEPNTKKSKRVMSSETRAKISQALKKRYEEKRGDTNET